jgi:hypothetical protein
MTPQQMTPQAKDCICPDEELHHNVGYDDQHGMAENAYTHPRRTNDNCLKDHPVAYNLNDKQDMAIDGFTVFIKWVEAVEWIDTFK